MTMSDSKHGAGSEAQGDENKLIAERRAKLARAARAGNAFPNDFRRDALAGQLHDAFGERSDEWLERQPDARHGRRAHDVQARDGQGELREARRPQRADPALPAGRGPGGGLRGLQGLGRRRHHRRARGAVPHQDGGAVGAGRDAAAAGEVAAAAAGQVARTCRHRDALPPALCRPDREREKPRGIPRAHAASCATCATSSMRWTSSRSRRR